jgi:hypothetical protein
LRSEYRTPSSALVPPLVRTTKSRSRSSLSAFSRPKVPSGSRLLRPTAATRSPPPPTTRDSTSSAVTTASRAPSTGKEKGRSPTGASRSSPLRCRRQLPTNPRPSPLHGTPP